MSHSKTLAILTAIAFPALVAGCSPKKIVAPLSEQLPGQVTYSNTDGAPSWQTSGSAMFTETVALNQTFKRQPHFTYVVFRDKQRNVDHVVTIEAVGDLTVTQGEVQVTDEASLFRIVAVEPVQSPITVSVNPKPVKLLELSSNDEEPRILVWSNGDVKLDYPSLFPWNDSSFGLDEVKSITYTKATIGPEKLTFALVDKEHELEFSSEGTAGQHFAELERLVKPMAPHVRLSSGRKWWPIVLLVILAIFVIGAIINKAKS